MIPENTFNIKGITITDYKLIINTIRDKIF